MQCIHEIDSNIREIELRKDPVIIQVNDFNEEEANKFRRLVSVAHNTGQKVIPVIVDSYGGQVYSLMSMISSIKSSKIPVATIVIGKAMSCGALLASFGTPGMRYIDPDATLMIHDVSSRAFGKVEELKADASEADRLNKKLFEMMAKNCNKPEDFFLKKIHDKGHADWFLNAEETHDLGIVDHINVPSMKIKVSLDIDII